MAELNVDISSPRHIQSKFAVRSFTISIYTFLYICTLAQRKQMLVL